MNEKWNTLREDYKEFIYKKYEIEDIDNSFKFTFYFEIPGLEKFSPTVTIPKGNTSIGVNDEFLNSLAFHMGLIESISYYKCCCPKNIIVEAGYLDDEQIEWWKDLYFNGLGEFFYVNSIQVSKDDLFTMISTGKKHITSLDGFISEGNIIPIGGGKDSCVSMEILKDENNSCFLINSKQDSLSCAKLGGYSQDKIIEVKRVIDSRLIELNKKGYLNGHTPFSACVAFISYTTAYIHGKKYIALSNESSANESTVIGTNINHQYSKTFDFEMKFDNYTKKYLNVDIHYFSLLRCLSEFQIGMLFSNYKKYYPVFKSCNVGSKDAHWNWCCSCPKCLFVYIILSPYLYKDELVSIFGQDLFEKEDMLNTFIELAGYSDIKPFECVGTINEVRFAVSKTIKEFKGNNLPYLLQYFKDNYPLEEKDIQHDWNFENNIPVKYQDLIRNELSKYAK